VAQLAGYVSEHSAYHHGEASLQQTIVGLAQDFVGSNNVNLLVPSGQFGTRLQGGKDAASPRYIYTRLAPLARHLFHKADDKLLRYLCEEGQSIEPEHYVPLLPTVLVNGGGLFFLLSCFLCFFFVFFVSSSIFFVFGRRGVVGRRFLQTRSHRVICPCARSRGRSLSFFSSGVSHEVSAWSFSRPIL